MYKGSDVSSFSCPPGHPVEAGLERTDGVFLEWGSNWGREQTGEANSGCIWWTDVKGPDSG